MSCKNTVCPNSDQKFIFNPFHLSSLLIRQEKNSDYEKNLTHSVSRNILTIIQLWGGGEGVQNHFSKPVIREYHLTLHSAAISVIPVFHSLLLSYLYFPIQLYDNFGKGWVIIHRFLCLWFTINPALVPVCSFVKQIKWCSSTAPIYYCQCIWRKMRGCDCFFLLPTELKILQWYSEKVSSEGWVLSQHLNGMLQPVKENWILLYPKLKTIALGA